MIRVIRALPQLAATCFHVLNLDDVSGNFRTTTVDSSLIAKKKKPSLRSMP